MAAPLRRGRLPGSAQPLSGAEEPGAHNPRLPQRRRTLELKRKLPSRGAQRIKDQFDLSMSEKAVRKIWREAGLLKRKRRKHKTKQNLREIKRRRPSEVD